MADVYFGMMNIKRDQQLIKNGFPNVDGIPMMTSQNHIIYYPCMQIMEETVNVSRKGENMN
ncbi:MAG: hypothetical protein ACE5RH_03420, partial [Nitrosarchaeum sp.]